jgi:hypothetical protein
MTRKFAVLILTFFLTLSNAMAAAGKIEEIPSILEILRTAKDTSLGINNEGVDKEDIARRIAEAQMQPALFTEAA